MRVRRCLARHKMFLTTAAPLAIIRIRPFLLTAYNTAFIEATLQLFSGNPLSPFHTHDSLQWSTALTSPPMYVCLWTNMSQSPHKNTHTSVSAEMVTEVHIKAVLHLTNLQESLLIPRHVLVWCSLGKKRKVSVYVVG